MRRAVARDVQLCHLGRPRPFADAGARPRRQKAGALRARGRRAFVFGSEIKSLLLHPAVKREARQAVAAYLTFGYVPDPQRIQRRLQAPARPHADIQRRAVRTRCYWNFNYRGESDAAARSERGRICRAPARVARRNRSVRLESEAPLGVFLSGGIDSSAVAALMAREARRRIKTFSIGFGEAEFDELRYRALPRICWEPIITNSSSRPTYAAWPKRSSGITTSRSPTFRASPPTYVEDGAGPRHGGLVGRRRRRGLRRI